MSRVGFSGTQEGMTDAQIEKIRELLWETEFKVAGHGDCIGADADFHDLSRERGLWMVGYPPFNYKKRAFCDFDEERRPNEYLIRNRHIVDDSDSMLFTPRGFEEELRSGTWSTIRYNEKKENPKVIVWPNGKTTIEGIEYDG
jgi:hypothetical protein